MFSCKKIHYWILLFFLVTPALPISGATARGSDDEANLVSEKPLSYALSRDTGQLLDLISEELFVEPEKHILISLADQKMWVFEGDTIIRSQLVSTGVPGHRTPTGDFSVRNRSTRAYSNRYECWMLHWMAITPDGLYGMHSLEGTSYLSHLGSVASHGCIRLSHENAEWLYNWVEIGTPVEIVDDWDEPPEAKSHPVRIGMHYCLHY